MYVYHVEVPLDVFFFMNSLIQGLNAMQLSTYYCYTTHSSM